MRDIKDFFSKPATRWLLAIFLFFLSICWYAIQGIQLSEHMHPMMDEGSYLLKGMFYLKGIYSPYQEFGPITNKPPFSFYSLGISQLIEPGLRSGRYFAVILGIVALIGLWLTIKRLFNIWWATGVAILVSFSTALIMYSSKAMTQVVTSLLLAWLSYFVLGKDRRLWHLCLGGFLAVLLPLTRQNLLPLYFLILIYLAWEHGKKGWISIAVSLSLFFLCLIFYWPGLFSTYINTYLPGAAGNSILTFFKIEFPVSTSDIFSNTDQGIVQETVILFQGFRNFLLPMIAAFMLLFTLPYRQILKAKYGKIILFLLSSFLFMVALHYYAVVSQNILINNFPSYLAFFWPIGFLLIPFAFTHTDRMKDRYLILVVLFILLLFTGLGFSLFENTSEFLLHLQVPRFKDMHFLPGTIEITSILTDKFNLVYKSQRYFIGLLSGFLSGLLFLAIAWLVWKLVNAKFQRSSFTWTLFSVLMVIGVVVSPTRSFSGDSTIIMCNSGDILTAQEKVGEELNSVIPENSLVYLDYSTPISLLYLPGVKVFPPQINKYFYFSQSSDDRQLEKFGYWNESLANKWLKEAEYIILGDSPGRTIEKNILKKDPERYSFILTTSTVVPCIDKTDLRVYKVNK